MKLSTQLMGRNYTFHSVREVMGKANHEKSATAWRAWPRNAAERVAARIVLSRLRVRELCENPAVPYEEDEVTRLILDDLNTRIYDEYKEMSIGELREEVLCSDSETLLRMGRGLSSEVIAAVCKLMSNLDLVYAARKIHVTAHCATTIGRPGTLSARLQPQPSHR